MLYKLKDKNGRALGVHECVRKELGAYLKGLPVQGAPYAVVADFGAPLLARFHALFWSNRFTVGALAGAGVVEIVNLLVRWIT